MSGQGFVHVQVKVLYELVTVMREQTPVNHWETGKMADVLISESGDLPDCVQKR